MADNLKPIVKWPGGKTSEAKKIIPLIQIFKGRFIDPFVGGGAIYFEVCAKKAAINDLSEELITLYEYIRSGNDDFFHAIHYLDNIRCSINDLMKNDKGKFLTVFNKLISKEITDKELRTFIKVWTLDHEQKLEQFTYKHIESHVLFEEVKKNLSRKFFRMEKLYKENGVLCDPDILDNLYTAFHSAFYMYIRHLYNFSSDLRLPKFFSIATFFLFVNFVIHLCFASIKIISLMFPMGVWLIILRILIQR